MFKRLCFTIGAASFLVCGAPALAGRTAIDEDPDGNPITASFSGYCDFNGEDCYDNSGIALPYQVSIGGADFTDRVIVTGNGLLTFGAPVDFFENSAVRDQIDFGTSVPLLTDYNRTLVSAGQSNWLDFGGVFMQSATLGVNPVNGQITATWFTCYTPTAPGVCPKSNAYSLTLTPTRGGFAGHFDFGSGSPENADRGYVKDGIFTATENDFFLAATFQGLAPGVPEPASWAMMIAGFGLMGATVRRRSGRALTAFSIS